MGSSNLFGRISPANLAAMLDMAQKSNAWEFPTKHPMVRNEDGSMSNVRLGSFTLGKTTYAIPTMVEGKQLSDSKAVGVAKKHGLDKYPSFKSVDEAEMWIQNNHGNIR